MVNDGAMRIANRGEKESKVVVSIGGKKQSRTLGANESFDIAVSKVVKAAKFSTKPWSVKAAKVAKAAAEPIKRGVNLVSNPSVEEHIEKGKCPIGPFVKPW